MDTFYPNLSLGFQVEEFGAGRKSKALGDSPLAADLVPH